MTQPLTVVCVWVAGHVPFTVEYVTKLESMARRYVREPFEFACLTDRPWLVPGHIRAIPIPFDRKVFGWWAKLQCFNAAHNFEGRMLYLDLDTLIVSDLDAVIDYPAPFALAPHAGSFEGAHGRAVIKKFNSSVMVWDAGLNHHLYKLWVPQVADRLWGDQDWIAERAADAAAMPTPWFPRISEITHRQYEAEGMPAMNWPAAAKVILVKKPKNIEARQTWPWFDKAWA